MKKGKIKDFLIASKDEILNAIIESDMLPAVIDKIVTKEELQMLLH